MGKPDSPSDDKDSFTSADEEVKEMTSEMENIDIGGDEFSLVVLADQFNKCLKNPELTLVEDIAGYKEVYKFLALLGSVFGWVGSDVYAKIATLEKFLVGEEKQHYQNIKTMIDYEIKNNLIKTKKNDDPSGSRTLLRLHRALEYIIGFLRRIDDIQEEDGCAAISRTAYEETLMKYHPWVVQKAAKMAMGLLPNKKGLILKVCPDGDAEKVKQAYLDFPKAVASMQRAYDKMQQYYSEKDLLDIP